MIFSENTTMLGASSIPMAEGYDSSYGISLALVEAARNDFAMFKAMVQADYREMAICKESTGVVREGEISALHEAVGGGIFKKIHELFEKLVAKLKSIFHNFMAKINQFKLKDKELTKKYDKELVRKSNLDKLEVKWREIGAYDATKLKEFDPNNATAGWNEEQFERVKYFLPEISANTDSLNEYKAEAMEEYVKDEDTVKLSEIGGWRALSRNLTEGFVKVEKIFKTEIDNAGKYVKQYKSKVDNAAKAAINDEEKDTELQNANKEYDMAQAYQTAILTIIDLVKTVQTIEYKQTKAAYMKAVTVNDKKLEESSIYAQAVAEAAEDEVENVINSALSDEEISDITAANNNVIDADVSDDSDKLTYGPDQYTKNIDMDDSEGTVDTCIGGGKVEETAFFGKMFY